MKLKLAAATALALILSSMPAHAEFGRTSMGAFSATVGAVSDYRFRGLSQTDEKPALQGGLQWMHDGGFYLGGWASNVDFPDADVEIDPYGGYKFERGGMGLDIGVIGYLYPDASSGLDYDYWEGKIAATYDIDMAHLGAAVYYSPEFFRGSDDALYVTGSASIPVSDTGFSVRGSAGHQWIDDNAAFGADDYTDWSLGLGYTMMGFDVAAKYVDTDLGDAECFAGADICDATGVVSISKTF